MAHQVLLVDPSPKSNVLSERLRMQGYSVTVTAGAAEGALFALSDPPAVVVADLWMPGISGVQLCRLIRSEPATEAVPVILRGPEENLRDRFWAERAGALAYIGSGRIGDLMRAIARAIALSPPEDQPFFTVLAGGELDLRDRIAAHLDAALFDSVIASEVRALGVCGTFVRLFDLLSQLVAQVSSYRWFAVHTLHPPRLALHAHPSARSLAEVEARTALGLGPDVPLVLVEDEDALDTPLATQVLVESITLGQSNLGRAALAPCGPNARGDADLLRVIARELGGPLRIAMLMEESERLALIDPLTGLMNRRAFEAAAAREMNRNERRCTTMSVLFLDVDHFKDVNDRFGHPIGDRVLATLGHFLPEAIRGMDVVGRWGGEEFIVVLSDCECAAAHARAEQIRAAVESLQVRDDAGRLVPLTISVGVASAPPVETLDTLIDRADRAMYAAKAAGRNRVVSDQSSTLHTPATAYRDVHDHQVPQ